MQRYGVSSSAGEGFQVWDRSQRKVVATRKTFKAAQKRAQELNDQIRISDVRPYDVIRWGRMPWRVVESCEKYGRQGYLVRFTDGSRDHLGFAKKVMKVMVEE